MSTYKDLVETWHPWLPSNLTRGKVNTTSRMTTHFIITTLIIAGYMWFRIRTNYNQQMMDILSMIQPSGLKISKKETEKFDTIIISFWCHPRFR